MSGIAPGGAAENGARSGKASCDLLLMWLAFPSLLPCLSSLAMGIGPSVLITVNRADILPRFQNSGQEASSTSSRLPDTS